MKKEERNYRSIILRAEAAFTSKKYLEAFLIQSCLVESVVKTYAFLSLKPILEAHPDLRRKSDGFELARLADELFIAGKIDGDLYEKLNLYRKKRNVVIHNILRFNDVKAFERELREAYKVGRGMQTFLVAETILKKKGKTTAEIVAKFTQDSNIYLAEVREAQKPFFRKMNRDVAKILKGVGKLGQ
jgi:hypothetical protein